MAKQKISKVQTIDGCVIESDYFYFSTKLDVLNPEKYDFSRVFYLYQNNWYHTDLDMDIVSVCLKSQTENEIRKVFSLSVQGDVKIAYLGGEELEKIPNSGSYNGRGALSQIKEINDHIYACGFEGQVYKRLSNNNWITLDENGKFGLKEISNPIHLNGISGINEKNIFVVGLNGKILKFNGLIWSEIESKTTEHLERIVCVSENEIYVCGNNGTFLKGNQNEFKNLSNSEIVENFWGIEYFNGNVYLSSLNGLFIYDGNRIEKLKTGLKPEINGYRLDSKNGILLSSGGFDTAIFDGKKWKRITNPQNE